MNPQLKTAIIEFIANEFHLSSDQVGPDTRFSSDLGLDTAGVSDLLQRLQDSLNFILPEESETPIETVSDLFIALTPTDTVLPEPDAI